MEETLFYVLGLALVALALITTFLGLRFENFPSRPVLVLGTALFAGLVVATAAFAWLNGEEEQDHRNELIASGEELSPQQGLDEIHEGTGAAAPGAEAPPPSETTTTAEEPPSEEEPSGSSVDGAQVFADSGCGGCHTLADAGTTGTTGPDLDGALKGKDVQFIEESIADPNAEVAKGYPPDVMPQNYGTDLSSEELDALASYLSQATGGSG